MEFVEHIKPDKRYLLAQEEDLNFNISLKTHFNDLNEYNNTRIISLSELFTKERNESTKYRIYGIINYLSFLTNKNKSTKTLADLFNDDYLSNGFNLEDFFDLRLYRLAPQQTYLNNTNNYVEKLTAITNDYTCKLNYYGYSKNIYNEKNYSFLFNTTKINPYEEILLDNDIIYDNKVYLGFIPKNNLVLYEKIYTTNDYVDYLDPNTEFGYLETDLNNTIISIINGLTNYTFSDFNKYFLEKLKHFLKLFNIKVTQQNINLNIRFIANYLGIGNNDYNTTTSLDLTQPTLEGNFIEFDKENYLFTEKIKKEYVIGLLLTDTFQGTPQQFNDYVNLNYSAFTKSITTQTQTLEIAFKFKFNPFYPIELKKYNTFSDSIFTGVTNQPIPPVNTVPFEDRLIWRDLMTYGDPENYDNPFINNTHYFYNDIIFMLKPDLSDRNTGILLNDFTLNFSSDRYNFKKSNIKITPEVKPGLCE